MGTLYRGDLHGDSPPPLIVRFLRWAWTRGLLSEDHSGRPEDDDRALLDLFDGMPGAEDFTEQGWAFCSAYFDLYCVEFDPTDDTDALLDRRFAEWTRDDRATWPRLAPPSRTDQVTWWQATGALTLTLGLVFGRHIHPAIQHISAISIAASGAAYCMYRYRLSRRPEWIAAGLSCLLMAALTIPGGIGAIGFFTGTLLGGLALVSGILRRPR